MTKQTYGHPQAVSPELLAHAAHLLQSLAGEPQTKYSSDADRISIGNLHLELEELQRVARHAFLLEELGERELDSHGRAMPRHREDTLPWISQLVAHRVKRPTHVVFSHDVDRTSTLEPLSLVKSAMQHLRGGSSWIGLPQAFSRPIEGIVKAMLEIEQQEGACAVWFFLAGPYRFSTGGSRTSCSWPSARRISRLIAEQGGLFGLHGSYRVRESSSYREERERLEESFGCRIVLQRNHYLRFHPERLPAQMEAAGFLADFSVGWPNEIGFRAGLAHAWQPWNHQANRPARHWSIPLYLMDRDDQLDQSARILADFEQCLDSLEGSGACLSVLIHPEAALVDNRWLGLYREMIQLCRIKGSIVDSSWLNDLVAPTEESCVLYGS